MLLIEHCAPTLARIKTANLFSCTYSDTKMFPLMIRPRQAVRAIRKQSYSLVCLNDNVHIKNYAQVMENIKDAFEHILPEKSSFER